MTARIALYAAGGSPYHHAAIFSRAGCKVSFLFPADIEAGALDGFDAFVMPGGGYLAMRGQLDPLGVSGCRAVRDYVERGGLYIGCCAGSYLAASPPASFRQLCPQQEEICLLDAEIWNRSEGDVFGLQSPGIGELVAESAAVEHPVMAGIPARFSITHYNGPFFIPGPGFGGSAGSAGSGRILARVAGAGRAFTPGEEFLGGSSASLVVERAAAAGAANIVAGERGRGRVVLFGSHPEFGTSVSLDDSGEAAQLLLNALAWQLEARGAPIVAYKQPLCEEEVDPGAARRDRQRLDGLVAGIIERCEQLREAGRGSSWLAPQMSMSLLGLSAADAWAASLERIPELATEVLGSAPALPPSRLSYRPPSDWSLDPGHRGVVPLLERTDEQLAQALEALATPPGGPPQGPYDRLVDSPYHLVAGSYLAAIGTITGAELLCRVAAGETTGEPAAHGPLEAQQGTLTR